MRIKIVQFGSFYIRIDLTCLDGLNSLLGIYHCEGEYIACTDRELVNCKNFFYSEVQFGFIFLTFAFGKELENEKHNKGE